MLQGAYLSNMLITCGGISNPLSNDRSSELSTVYRNCYGRSKTSSNWQDLGNMPIVRIAPSSVVLTSSNQLLIIGKLRVLWLYIYCSEIIN